ncbi:MAG: NADPH-dependent FMN reductase [Patescibacteria group bacterium]
MKTVAVLVGSLRKESFNRSLFEAFKKYAPADLHFQEVSLTMPLYNADVEERGIPEEVQRAKEIIDRADGVLIVTPEYNRSLPGVLKNAIDWTSRPGGKSSWKGKRVAGAGATNGSLGTAPAQQHLRSILVYLDTRVMGQPEFYLSGVKEKIDTDGTVRDVPTKERVEKFLASFLAFLEA